MVNKLFVRITKRNVSQVKVNYHYCIKMFMYKWFCTTNNNYLFLLFNTLNSISVEESSCRSSSEEVSSARKCADASESSRGLRIGAFARSDWDENVLLITWHTMPPRQKNKPTVFITDRRSPFHFTANTRVQISWRAQQITISIIFKKIV